MDFTGSKYQELLQVLVSKGYVFKTVSEYPHDINQSTIYLRHDVDDLKMHSLAFARIQHKLGVKGTYYFRMVPESFDEKVILEIAQLGHEVGYHYEDMDFANGDADQAIKLFEKHLAQLRALVTVTSICMHGSPRSKFDNKDVWKKYDYKKYGIKIEPYFDIDFNQMFYLTDTGRCWDGFKYSVRDKIITNKIWPVYSNTNQIIRAIHQNTFPSNAMFNFHPQRWTDDKSLWLAELFKQSIKNLIKKYFFVKK
jgi:hypothetical protein